MNRIARSTAILATAVAAAAAITTASDHHSDRRSGHSTGAEEVARYTIELGLSGYSPVSYIEHNRAEPGSPLFTAEHAGVTYFLTSERQRRVFVGDPERYLPAYGGYCAFGCSVDSKFIPDPTSFVVIEGRTHLFLKKDEVDARSLWNEADPREVKNKADRFWQSQRESRAYINGRNVPASGVGLEGYSPVSYFTEGRAEKGDARYAVEHNGVTYHLTSAAQVELF